MNKSRGRYSVRFSGAAVLLTALAAVLAGCGGSPATSTVTTPPADFKTYTDASGLFGISYPPDWAPALSDIATWDAAAKEVIQSLDVNAPIPNARVVFFAGITTDIGLLPNVNIVVEGLPANYTFDGMVQAEIAGVKNVLGDYRQSSLTKVTVDGRAAAIVEYDGTPPQAGRLHYVQMFALEGNIVWAVSCACLPGEAGKREKDFQAIVHSLHVYK